MRRATHTYAQTGGAGVFRPLPGRNRIVAVAAVIAVALGAAGCGTSHRHTAAPASPPRSAAKPRSHPAEPASVVASARSARVPVYRRPGARTPFREFANPTAAGEPLVFLVLRRSPGWEQVYLPVRPNESTGWIRDRDVRLAFDPYSLQVRLRARQLLVRERGRILSRIPAGVGRSVLPTPTGRYYIVNLLKQPDPSGAYGPYAFGLSAYSNVLFSFGGGPGEIGLHGTDDPHSIGRDVSHGCIRIPNQAIARLARELPLGTPVTIGA
jgi:lipoprotein-anchoring transpeptidase ErfK/SrfK